MPTFADAPATPATPPARLFPALPAEAAGQLDRLGAVLARVRPLKAKHARDLPQAVSDLSHALTDERGSGFSPDYMASPRLLSAYLTYFLPWNIYRLARLFTGLDLPLAAGARIVDLGSGPLTVPLALWIARPELRALPLELTCLDKSAGAMKAGLQLFREMAPESPWRVHLVTGPATHLAHERAALMTAAFVLNEIAPPGRGREAPDVSRLAEQLARGLAPGGRLLVAEPGTRLAARRLVALRRALVELEVNPLAPCTHGVDCPLTGTGHSGWCHFNFDTRGAPNWLAELSAKAGLGKRNASLSFLLAAPAPAAGTPTAVRAISEPFPLADGRHGVYGCAASGLVLLSGLPEQLPRPGEALTPAWPEHPERDAKSGAAVIPLAARPAKRTDAAAPKPHPKTAPAKPGRIVPREDAEPARRGARAPGRKPAARKPARKPDKK